MKDNDILKQYFSTISKFPRITREDEIDLANRIKKGDKKALDKLVNSNLRLVVKISINMRKGNSSIMDIIQNGNIGLMRAAKKFDPERGVKFSTYSAFWIKQSILRGFIKTSQDINISFRKDEINKRINSYIRQYELSFGKLPSLENIMINLSVNRRDALDSLMGTVARSSTVSTQKSPVSGDELIENVHDDSYNPQRVMEYKAFTEDINIALDSLPGRDSDIVKRRFGFINENKETLQDLGNKYSISAEAARQIERRVISMMKIKFPALAYYYYAA